MSDTERKVGVNERLLAAIVDIQHYIKHGVGQDSCAACVRWDEVKRAAVSIVDEVNRLKAEVKRLKAERDEAVQDEKRLRVLIDHARQDEARWVSWLSRNEEGGRNE